MAFPDNCTPRVVAVTDSAGCTLTRASIRAFTPADFEAQGMKEVGMDKIIAEAAESRMTGVRENILMDLLLSRFAPIKTINLGAAAGRSVIAPWIYKRQRHQKNANYFEVESGAAHPTAGVGSVPASAWNVVVKNSGAQFATSLSSIERYFLPDQYVTVFYKDTANGDVGRTVQLKVYASANADAGATAKATITLIPPYSTAGWAALSSAEKAIFQPEGGVLILMANSVSNYESWCNNHPSDNTLKMQHFWLQTIRRTHQYNEEYVQALNAALTSNYFRKFKELPLAEQKKQQAYEAEKAFYNTVFYGNSIDENQTIESYEDLPQVVDPLDSNCVIEYKANTHGIRTQLANCGRVTDLQGAALDIDALKSMAYSLKRHREIDSGTIDTIDVMTDRHTRGGILTVMIDYYKQKYGLNTERFYQANQTLKFNNITGLASHDIFEFPDENVRLAVFSHDFFDDRLAAFPSAHQPVGRAVWAIDWSDFQIGLAGAKSVTRRTNEADDLYNCVITPNINRYELSSKTIAVIMQDANRSAIYENFSSECPTISATGCTASS